MAIVNFKTGEVLNDRQIKRAIMEANGWTSEEYQKRYDVLRNRVRNYEQVTGQSLGGKIRVNELLYQTTKAQKRYGGAYRPSALVRGVMATPSKGTGLVQREGISKRAFKNVEETVLGRFDVFVEGSKKHNGQAWQLKEGYDLNRAGVPEKARAEIELLNARAIELRQLRAEGKGAGATKAELARITAELKAIQEDIRYYNQLIEKASKAPKTLAELKTELARISKTLKKAKKDGYSIAGGY